MGDFIKFLTCIVVLFNVGGCKPLITRRTQTPMVDKSSRPTMKVERSSDLDVKYEVDDESVLQVAVMKRTYCQKRRVTPQRMRIREENELDGSDLTWSIIGAGLGGVSIGVGVVNLAAPCKFSDEPSCKESEMQAIGGAMIGVGTLFFVPLIVNGVRAADSEEFEDTAPKIEPVGKPEQCDIEPVTEATVTVTLADANFEAEEVTDANGMATIDLTGVPWEGHRANEHLQIAVNGKVTNSIKLDAVPSYVAFVEGVKAQRQRRRERDAAERRRQHALLKSVVGPLDGWARSAIGVQWASAQRNETRCFNKVDFEVPCTSAAAVKRQDDFKILKQATVTNSGKLEMVCGQSGDFLGTGKAFVRLPAGKSTKLPILETTGLGLFLGLGTAETVVCVVPTATLSKSLGVDLSPVVGQEENVVIGVIGSSTYVFASPDKDDKRVFMWEHSDVVVKTSD